MRNQFRMKTDSAIYIFSTHPVFNPVSVKSFSSFDKADSVILYSTLLENLIEIVKSLKINLDFFILLSLEDENLIKITESDYYKIKFLSDDYNEELINYFENKSLNYQNNLLILSDSIGISATSISHCFNLLNIEDDSLVIGKTFSGHISFIAYNNIDGKTINYLLKSEFDYMKFLAHMDSCPAFINIMEKFQRIISIEDFKKLYTELSKKESLNYCSQEMHERFTHLFIEHKELLQ
jgi:hypothetical protein